jgi:hypothetical protein
MPRGRSDARSKLYSFALFASFAVNLLLIEHGPASDEMPCLAPRIPPIFLEPNPFPAQPDTRVNDPAAGIYERLLILRCQNDDEAALGELIARYSPGLR